MAAIQSIFTLYILTLIGMTKDLLMLMYSLQYQFQIQMIVLHILAEMIIFVTG